MLYPYAYLRKDVNIVQFESISRCNQYKHDGMLHSNDLQGGVRSIVHYIFKHKIRAIICLMRLKQQRGSRRPKEPKLGLAPFRRPRARNRARNSSVHSTICWDIQQQRRSV